MDSNYVATLYGKIPKEKEGDFIEEVAESYLAKYPWSKCKDHVAMVLLKLKH